MNYAEELDIAYRATNPNSVYSRRAAMSLLDNLPHKCLIRRRKRTRGSAGGGVVAWQNEQSDVACWEQPAGDNEVREYARRGIAVTRKIYFTTDPAIGEQHQVIITERRNRDGTTTVIPQADWVELEVRSRSGPDTSAGLGVLYAVMAGEYTAAEQPKAVT